MTIVKKISKKKKIVSHSSSQFSADDSHHKYIYIYIYFYYFNFYYMYIINIYQQLINYIK